MNLQPLTVEGRNKTFGGCLSLLAESLFNADSAGKIQYPDIFFRRNGMLKLAAFRLGKLFQMRERRILIHNTDIDVISVSVMKVTKDSFGIACLARQEQMADNEPPFHHTVPGAEHRSFYLAEHFPDCQAGFLKIIGGMRKSLGQKGRMIFQIREIDIHQTVQQAKGRNFLIGGGIVYNRNEETGLFRCFQGKAYLRKKMACCHQVNIGSALFLQFQKDPGKTVRGQYAAPSAKGDVVILAIDTPKAATGEKYSAGTAFSGKTGLLPVMESSSGCGDIRTLTAETGFSFQAVDMALSGAEGAVFHEGL